VHGGMRPRTCKPRVDRLDTQAKCFPGRGQFDLQRVERAPSVDVWVRPSLINLMLYRVTSAWDWPREPSAKWQPGCSDRCPSGQAIPTGKSPAVDLPNVSVVLG